MNPVEICEWTTHGAEQAAVLPAVHRSTRKFGQVATAILVKLHPRVKGLGKSQEGSLPARSEKGHRRIFRPLSTKRLRSFYAASIAPSVPPGIV